MILSEVEGVICVYFEKLGAKQVIPKPGSWCFA